MPVDRRTFVGAASILIGCSGLSGCVTPPDQQAPIPLKPGQYAITMNGSLLGFSSKKNIGGTGAPKSVCLDGTDDAMMHKLSSLVTKTMPSNDNCTVRDAERRGNAISAGSTCPFDGQAGAGTMKIAFDAVVAEEAIEGAYSFKYEGQPMGVDAQEQAKSRLAMAALGVAKLNVHFTRTGDCTAETRSNPWGQ